MKRRRGIVYKQRGEEYRVHGQWGWLWLSCGKKLRHQDCRTMGLKAKPYKMMIQVKEDRVTKIIAVDHNMYNRLIDRSDLLTVPESQIPKPPAVPVVKAEPDTKKEKGATTSKEAEKKKTDEATTDAASKEVKTEVVPTSADQSKQDKEDEEVNVTDDKETPEPKTTAATTPVAQVPATTPSTPTPPASSATPSATHRLLVFRPVSEFEEIDISRALTIPGRLAYPKVAKPSKLDEFLHRRVQLKMVEERQLAMAASPKTLKTLSPLTPGGSSTDAKVDLVGSSDGGRSQKEVDQMSKEVAHHLELYSAAHRISRDHPCYNSLCKANSSTPNCYSPMCMHRYRLRKDLLMTLCKAKAMGIDINSKIGAQALSQQNRVSHPRKQELQPKVEEKKAETVEVTTQVTTVTTTTTTTTTTEVASITAKINPADGVLKAALKSPDSLKSRQHLLRPPTEPVDTQRIYSSDTPKGKLYLKKIVRAVSNTTMTTQSALSTVLTGQAGNLLGRRKKMTIKYPVSSKFCTQSKKETILVLPQHDLRKLARRGGTYYVHGFNHNAKANQSVWPYPCSRPLFKTCWLYRTAHLNSLSGVAMQLRILWHCLRWDDMQTKPPNNDGKNQITTDTEITTTEILKHRHLGQFLERTQYLRRKVVIPLELPKTVREVTSIRVGLRKRKREETPQSTEPQVTEEWVEEDRLELWEIKQYGDRMSKANTQVVTRSRTGSLAPTRVPESLSSPATPALAGTKQEATTTGGAAGPTRVTSAEEIKQQMEQNLRLQRAAHNQRRSLDPLTKPNILKVTPSTPDGMTRTVAKVAIPATPGGKTVISSPAQAGGTPVANKTYMGAHRIFMTKGADGTTRVVPGPTSILPKGAVVTGTQSGQSLIRIQPAGTTNTQATSSPTVTTTQQKVQIVPGPDGKFQVRGLLPA
ncbi:hypothetical protein B566_EDAN015525 [Ephemera danica]|nr:hypothetical protein B566_EDAN015525 [Ephemera danica]